MGEEGLGKDELDRLVERTPFTRKEVRAIHSRWKKLAEAEGCGDVISREEGAQLPELRANPFAERILSVFSEDGGGALSFPALVDLLAAFSPRASEEVKMIWAFALWDFDGDDLIGVEDIREGVMLTTGVKEDAFNLGGAEHFTVATVMAVVEQVCEEVDPDGWGLNFTDFRNVLNRMPDFAENFRMPMHMGRSILGF